MKLDPFLGKDCLLRIKGRLQLSDLSYDEKHPIILPKCHILKLLVRFQHEILKHAGVDTVITSLRNSYWIIGVRRLAKQVKRECVSCQRIDAPACNQNVAPLPELRVQKAPPFTVTGMDYAGPMYCSDLPKKKLYILLFTCAIVRAVHLELTESLHLSDFMLAFRRFIARRGIPTVLYSDNAKTFHGAQVRLLNSFGSLSPKWRFIVPRSPWWGGWWERLVRSVKGALKKSIGSRCLTRVELETTLLEVEACVNSRPLTFAGDNVDNTKPLTPSHFLIGRPAGLISQVNEDVGKVSRNTLTERDLIRQNQLERFWSQWSQDYLRNLPPVIGRFKAQGQIRVGSVVLIREDNVTRLKWPMGVVTEVYPGKDGSIRSVQLKTKGGIFTRPIQRLHNLEVTEFVDNISDNMSETGDKQTENIESIVNSKTEPNQSCVIKDSPVVTRSGRIIKPVQRLEMRM